MITAIRSLIITIFGTLLTACMVVDEFSSRIYAANVNSQVALDQETFLNIVRASRFQPLTFVAISKVSGQQVDSLNVGLPSFTLGPQQTLANRLYTFGSNSVSANAQGNFDSNPLISSAFQEGMMSPISQRVLALLIRSHNRELVALAVVDGIRLTELSKPHNSWYFKNDPSNNIYIRSEGGNDLVDDQRVCDLLEKVTPDNKENQHYVTVHRIKFGIDCNYSMFVHYLRWGLDLGLTADITSRQQSEAKLQSANVGSTTNALNSPAPPGKLCFDPSLARPDFGNDLHSFKYFSSKTGILCSKINEPKGNQKFSFNLAGSDFSIELNLRSPIGIYNYLGSLIRNNQTERVRRRQENSDEEFFEPFVDISAETSKCLIDSSSIGGYVCDASANDAFSRNSLDSSADSVVPGSPPYAAQQIAASNSKYYVIRRKTNRARSTLALISILQQLRNLMIQPVDLNSSFSVRLAP